MRKLKIYLRNLLVAIGVISSFVTIFWALFPNQLNTLVSKCPWIFLAGILVLALAYATYSVRQKNNIALQLTKRVKANIYFNNIFNGKGIIVIPFNEYFDTLVDDRVISSQTLHGQFIKKYFGGNESSLRDLVKHGLDKYSPNGITLNRAPANTNKYPMGTVCEILKDGQVFYLVALSRFNRNNRAEITNCEYQKVLCDLFTYIEQNSQGRKVNIPLIGAGHLGVNSAQKILEFLLLSISMNDNLTLINGIDIVLHESIRGKIDLSRTEVLFNSIGY